MSTAGALVVRAGEALSWRIRVRSAVVVAALAVTAAVVAIVALGLGEIRISAADVVRTLVGDTDPVLETTLSWRLPREAVGLLFGAALGLGGAVFQSLTRNPLGSPDIIGFDAGAYTGALLGIAVVGTTALAVPTAIGGGVTCALLVYLLAFTRGVLGFRLIVVGIAITSMLGALNAYLVLRMDLFTAQMAALWGAGSVNQLDWGDVRLAAVPITAAALVLAWRGRRLWMLELGDDAAAALGVPVERTRLTLLVAATAMTATVTALAGPIVFVSLAAPQLARRLTRAPGVQLVPSAVMGSALFVTCDLIAWRAFPAVLPVGLITIVLGGGYLIWLLLLEARKEPR